MPSKATDFTTMDTDEHSRPLAIDVTVIHRDTDSFSRSVDRAANKYVMALMRNHSIPGGEWACVDAQYAHDEQYAARDTRKWCVSTITYVRKD